MAELKIPMMYKEYMEDIIFSEHEFGDPKSITITLPSHNDGKIHLPRHFFSKEILDHL